MNMFNVMDIIQIYKIQNAKTIKKNIKKMHAPDSVTVTIESVSTNSGGSAMAMEMNNMESLRLDYVYVNL